MAGAHQHHQLDLLVVVVLLLEQKEMDVVGAVWSEFYGGSGCWTSERWMSGLEKDLLTLKLSIFCHKPTPCLHQSVATLQESAVSGSCAKRAKGDKKIQLMVLMSTRPVAPHIAGCMSSIPIYVTPG